MQVSVCTLMPHNVSLLTIHSTEPRAIRPKRVVALRYVHHFTMTFEQWRAFFNHKIYEVYDNWGNQLMPHFYRLGITCTIIFRYHHVRRKNSRKNRCKLFSGIGRCKADKCPVSAIVEVEDAPKNKGSPCVFKVVIIGDKNHNKKQEKVARPVTGAAREALGMLFFLGISILNSLILAKEVNQIGALGVYERKLRYANEDLLKEGNFSEVPSIDVLKTTKQQYNKKYRFDEDSFKELRMS